MTKDKAKSSFGEQPFDYGRAFCDGVMRFRDEWNPATPEFSVDISGRPSALSDLCRLVRNVGGHLPKDVLNRYCQKCQALNYQRRAITGFLTSATIGPAQ
jgi:hypothetical protein